MGYYFSIGEPGDFENPLEMIEHFIIDGVKQADQDYEFDELLEYRVKLRQEIEKALGEDHADALDDILARIVTSRRGLIKAMAEENEHNRFFYNGWYEHYSIVLSHYLRDNGIYARYEKVD